MSKETFSYQDDDLDDVLIEDVADTEDDTTPNENSNNNNNNNNNDNNNADSGNTSDSFSDLGAADEPTPSTTTSSEPPPPSCRLSKMLSSFFAVCFLPSVSSAEAVATANTEKTAIPRRGRISFIMYC